MGKANIHDVAALAGVSSATVSRALRGLPTVATPTRDKIIEAASRLDYHINRQASGLASGRTWSIGLVAPWLGTWYTSQVIAGAEQVLGSSGYDMLVASVTTTSIDPFLSRTQSFGQRVDGTILVDVYLKGADLERLEQLGGPIVAFGEPFGSHPSVSIDNSSAARTATQHLLELGHRRVGLVRGCELDFNTSPVPQRREAGWREAHRLAGLAVDEDLMVDGYDMTVGGQQALDWLMALDEPPTAVFCSSDQMAFGLLAAARRRGMQIPGDLSVIGFDDHTSAEALGLTTMRQNVLTMASTAVSCLVELVEGREPAVRSLVEPVELVLRGTTGPPLGVG